ncbi:ech hydrogenase subunit D [Methanospirillum hungatei JF-1]|uniref:Ech hydrogenase subunit D n=1 Tax=Methanospirillum hungatei JF-1 (strain ATCC 27890 / DSM 864 / NBRC 100397 / JF-1) TaxID=323259 RepID=Q2FL37_METHJ|nr:NADH-quinone oxidoreductase subunit C [Methanospirillum hungatei]ABD41466.1 ech hydrogenase subunit D [Methanospirillum hungatei JF-1]
MKQPQQTIKTIAVEELIHQVHSFHDDGYRLVQISCASEGDAFEVTYSFDKDLTLIHLRIPASTEKPIPSISRIYLAAFVYENEIADLFGIPFSGIAIDYKGTFIRTSIPHPFGSPQISVVKKKPEGQHE